MSQNPRVKMGTLIPYTWHLTPCYVLCFHTHSGLERRFSAPHRPESGCLNFPVGMSTLTPRT